MESIRVRGVIVASAIAALVIAATATNGAYFSQSWGWLALAFLVPTTIFLILGHPVRPGPFTGLFAALVVGLAAWTALSSLWAVSAPASLREVERMLVYVALALGMALVLRRRDIGSVIAGVVTGIVVVTGYGVASRLFPDRIVVAIDPAFENRLGAPLGYSNAVGLLAAIGFLLAFGVVAQSRRATSAAAAGLVLPVLVAALYFAFSRGAWFAVLLGAIVLLALDPQRHVAVWSLLLTAAPLSAFVLLTSRHDALTTSDSSTRGAASEGRTVAVLLLATCLASAVAAYAAHRMRRRPTRSGRAIRATNIALGTLAAVGAVAFAATSVSWAASGLPESTGTRTSGYIDLNSRLFSLHAPGRSEFWRVALDDLRESPLTGEGAGSFEYSWYANRPSTQDVRDAHSLYLEAGGELGVVGLVLLAGALLVPFAAAYRARRVRFVPAAAAAYTAWVADCAVDWHWEMVGLTVTALLAGGVALLGADRGRPRPLSSLGHIAILAASIALSVAATWSLVGNQALAAGTKAAARGDWASALEDGRRAQAILFWSFEPELVIGDARAGLGDRPGALTAYRRVVARDPGNWAGWLRLAQVAAGSERAAAYARVHELNPLETDLPGETSASSN